MFALRKLVFVPAGTIADYTVCERVTVGWGGGGLLWSSGGGTLRLMTEDFYAALKDISYVMKRRAQTDYGLKVYLCTFGSSVVFVGNM